MSIYRITTAHVVRPNLEVLADDETEALSRATDAGILEDGDEGGIEGIVEPEGLEDYEPEGPG